MSFSLGDQKRCDPGMGDTLHLSSLGSPIPDAVPGHLDEFLFFQDEGAAVTLVCVYEAEAQPSVSFMTLIPVEETKQAPESMSPPPAKREIVLGQRAPSATPIVTPKGHKRPCANPDAAKKRRCTKDVEIGPSSLGASDSGLMPQHRAKFVSLGSFEVQNYTDVSDVWLWMEAVDGDLAMVRLS
ncbi:hypothetical protein DY000_02015979 [Brassica cretica]|uniref:Uncharacterized protein n=1 Tax=Brassica cretica TaxID=69181 RepID=A0ABQ7CN74_BRACR|nr:hypothetical protein DY000_02015979 [Brassica cretica]